MKWFLILAAAVSLALACSASAAVDFTGLTVTRIELRDDQGKAWPNPERLIPLLDIKPGDPYSGRAVSAGVKYLYLKGLFKDVQAHAVPEGSGVRVDYVLVPLNFVDRVVVSGRHVISREKIREITDRLEGKAYREDKLLDVRLDIASLYQAEGYYDVRMSFRTEPARDPYRLILHVNIDENEPTVIGDIYFLGNIAFTREQLLAAMKSKKGKPLRQGVLLDEDAERLRQLYAKAGYPAARSTVVDISIRHRKAFITLSGDEGPRVSVAFSGNKRFSDGKLKEALLIWSERDASDAAIEGSADKIAEQYRQEGYADCKVEVKKRASQGRLDLEFVIREGPRVTVETITFTGNTVFRTKDLEEGMALQESSWYRSRPYREDLLRNDLEAVRDRYIADGYLNAVVDRKAVRSADGKSMAIAIAITEGIQTKVGSVSFQGNTAVTAAELLAKVTLRAGMPYNERLVEEDTYRILSFYTTKGYLYAKVEAEKQAQNIQLEGGQGAGAGAASAPQAANSRTITLMDIRYRIIEDRQVLIGKIILRGNESTQDYVITRELLVKSGAPYDYEAILKSQQRIYRLGYFGLARFEPLQPGERGYVKDVLLTVEERPAGAVEFGVGYGNLDLLRGFVEVSHRNIWGTAKTATIRLEGSDILQRAIFSIQEPWFLGYRLDTRFSLAWSDAQRINPATRDIYYSTRKTTAAFGVENKRNSLKTSLVYQFENVDNYDVKPGAILAEEDKGRVRISSITPGVTLDLRDDPFNPRRGSLHGVAVKEAMNVIGSKADFTKLSAQSSWFLPVSRKTVLALSGRAGLAWPSGSTTEIPINERFYLGGATTVRGYLEDAVGPKGTDGTPTGGSGMVVFNAEFRITVLDALGLVLFTDAGNVWLDPTIHLHDLRAGYGAGLRYATPVGPLRVDYGQKINRQPDESAGELYFTIGQAF